MAKLFPTLRQPVNLIFLIQTVTVFLVAFGVWPRILIIPLAILVAIFVLWAKIEDSTAFFIRSVPLFVAVPFTSYFDSFNIWRITAGLIFLKWIYKSSRENSISKSAIHLLENSRATSRGSKVGGIADLLMAYPLASLLITFILLSALSLLVAENFFTGLKRIIYLVNLSLIPLVIYDLIKKNPVLSKKFLGNILISGVIVAGVGIAQLFSAYLLSLDAFLDFWGGTVQLGFYGTQWSNIALEGNTWFAYFGNQLSLRVFSTFTDSHSFPVYLLMSVPALLAFQKKKWLVILLPIFYLLAILSGTRGIWLAVLAPLLVLPFLFRRIRQKLDQKIIKTLGLLLIPFLVLFSVAFPIMGSDQFGLQKEDSQILGRRIRSILDLEETSNSDRLEIWAKTADSILRRPFLGVGLGNFPTVLSQHTDLAKAGSSAHNLYLHIASEIGLLGLLAALGILVLILKRAWRVFIRANQPYTYSKTPEEILVGLKHRPRNFSLQRQVEGREWVGMADWSSIKIYSAAFILYSLWVLFYSLTDAILFDERVFLVFAINSAIILGLYKTKTPQGVEI